MNGNQTSSRLRHAIILALGLGISNFAFSLRLGPINVKSYLGQPINATIRVDGLNAGAASSTKVSLASPAAYRSHGIEMLPIHSQMRFSLIPSGKGYIIHVTSTGGVKEPFVNFLVTVSGNGSTVTREYAAFFNPNPANASAGKSSKPTVVVEKNPSQKSNSRVIAERSEPPKTRSHAANTSGWGGKPVARKPVAKLTPKPAPQPVRPTVDPIPVKSSTNESSGSPNTPSSIPVGSNYGPIKPGETLYSIAKAARPNENMRIYDMMRLIYKANRHAFIGKDMGNLMAGATLHIPDPGNRGTAKPVSEKKPTPKPTPKSEKIPTPPPSVEEKIIVPEKVPTSPTAQLALGIDDEKKTEIPKPSEVNLPSPSLSEKEEKQEQPTRENTQEQSEGLKLDSPESIDNKNVEVPPPVVELPKPEPVEAVKPEPKPEPKPTPRPAPVVEKPVPAVPPAPVEDDAFFGLGKYIPDFGISLPLLGGAFAGLLAILGGLFWFLRKRKKPNADGQMEEFTEEQIQQIVAEMEEEHGDVNFDQVTSGQGTYDENSDQPMITKLDPISEPYTEDQGSVDELSDDFFKDLEVSVDEGEHDGSEFINDEAITDNTEIGDNFFDDLEFEGDNTETTSKEHKSHSTSTDDFDDFLSDNTTTNHDDFLSDLDDSPFAQIDNTINDESKPADDFDDFFSTGSEDDFPTDDDDLSASKVEQPIETEDSLDFLDNLIPEEEKPKEDTPEVSSYADDNSLDFFTDIEQHDDDSQKDEATNVATDDFNVFSSDENSLDFFDTSSEDEDNFDPEKDFFADESKTSMVELEKKEEISNADDEGLDFFTDPVSEAIVPESEVPPKPPAPSLARPSAPKLAEEKPAKPPTSAPKVDEDAMEINLDMAKSFISMGKHEKARSWLEEVLDLGTEDQKSQARKMLSNIDKG